MRKAVERLGLHPDTIRKYMDEGSIMEKNISEVMCAETQGHVASEEVRADSNGSALVDAPLSGVSLTCNGEHHIRDAHVKASDLEPYWTEFCAAISSRLSSPADIMMHAKPYKSKTIEESWFSTELNTLQNKNSQPIFSPSFTYSPAELTACENTVVRSKKIRIYPTKNQLELFSMWHDASRWCYNYTVELLNSGKGQTPNWMLLAKFCVLSEVPERFKDVPFQVKKIAVQDAVKAFKLNKKLVAQGQKTHFEMHFRSRKNPLQSCFIPSTAVRGGGIYPTKSGNVKFAEELPTEIKDSRLTKHRDRWYLAIPTNRALHVAETQGRVVAIDPGVRKFATLFSSDESIFGSIGSGDFKRIFQLGLCADQLLSEISKEKRFFRKSNLKRALHRLKNRISDLITELHCKVVKFLVDNFDIIILPTFNVSEMVVRGLRKIRSKTVRAMLSLRHYQFTQRLADKCFEYGRTLVRCSEAYTSKTNSWTGEINYKLGGRKFIQADSVRICRDLNGARGIFLRALGDTPWLKNAVLETASVRNVS